MKWYDNKAVVLATTFAKAHLIGTIQRWDRSKKQMIQVDYPNAVKQYNKFMGFDGISIRALKWYDNIAVVLATTFAKAHLIGTIQRWDRSKKQMVQVDYPNAVKQYNKFMGGVDLLDAYLAYYRTHLRSKKYYLRLFFHLLDLAVVNSWLLYRRDCDSLQYRIKNKKISLLLNCHLQIAYASMAKL